MSDEKSNDAAVAMSDWLAGELHRSGTTHLFFMDAILRRTLLAASTAGITPVLAHSEKAAAYMADGYARAVGRPGVCMAQSVGAANLAAGLQDAFLARSPVLAVTGRKPASYQHRNAYQEVSHGPLFAPLTKFSAIVERSEDLPRLLRHAWRQMITERPGPVHLDLEGLQGEITERTMLGTQSLGHLPGMRTALSPFVDDTELDRAVSALSRGVRPVIVAGDDAMRHGAGPSVLALSHRLGAPVATTVGARGIIPTASAPAIGTVGTYGAPPTNRIVATADVAILIGCDTSDQATCGWTVPPVTTQVIEINTDPLQLSRNYPSSIGLCGELSAIIAALIEGIGDGRQPSGFVDESVAGFNRWRESMMGSSSAVTATTEELCRELSRCLPKEAILVSDTGNSAIWTSTMVELNGSQTYLRAAGSLGWSFPAALGAKCAVPDRPVVCFCGDGGFYYHLSELETARRYGLSVTVVVNNNSGFGQAWPEVSALDGPDQTSARLVSFAPVDFARVAEAFGVNGFRVESSSDIRPALQRAFSVDGPAVVDVATLLQSQPPQASRP